MRILTIEFASSGFMKEASEEILVEGFYMLRLVSNGLARAGNEVFTLLSKDAENLGKINSEIISDNELTRIANNLNVDYVFPIAPDSELAEIAEVLNSEGIRCISSDIEAIRAPADKWETYRILKSGGIDTPNTVLGGSNIMLDYPLIIKDRYGVACEGLQRVDCQEELTSVDSKVLQEFIQGENASVTLFSDGRKAIPVSLNKQEIEFRQGKGHYGGGEVPLEHSLRDEAFNIAKKAVESIPGLKGCVGVDVLLADKPYVIEINPRVTTSMIALEMASGLNIGDAALESFLGELPKPPEFKKKIRFRKEFSGGVCNGLEFESV